MKSMILSCVERQTGTALDPNVPDDFNLLAEGIIDSIGFVQLIAEIEEAVGVPLDFGDLDPEQLTEVGPLARYIAARCSAAS